jgi:hypothetical protein
MIIDACVEIYTIVNCYYRGNFNIKTPYTQGTKCGSCSGNCLNDLCSKYKIKMYICKHFCKWTSDQIEETCRNTENIGHNDLFDLIYCV